MSYQLSDIFISQLRTERLLFFHQPGEVIMASFGLAGNPYNRVVPPCLLHFNCLHPLSFSTFKSANRRPCIEVFVFHHAFTHSKLLAAPRPLTGPAAIQHLYLRLLHSIYPRREYRLESAPPHHNLGEYLRPWQLHDTQRWSVCSRIRSARCVQWD
jgi:hypothetical protein